MILKPTALISLAAMPPTLPKPWTDDAGVFGALDADQLESFECDDHAAAAGGLGTAARAAESERLAGDDGGDGVARVHGVGVHDPGHHLLIGIDVGRGHVAFRSDEVDDLGGVAAGELFELGVGEHVGIADDAALAAAERDVDHGAFPGHPGGERAHFVEGDVGGEANAAFGGTARDRSAARDSR